MNKRRTELFEEVYELIELGNIVPVYHQVQPNTVCILEYDGIWGRLTSVGFSKVCWPDIWHAEFGRTVALEHALSHLWKQVKKRVRISDANWISLDVGKEDSNVVFTK